ILANLITGSPDKHQKFYSHRPTKLYKQD
ncbi:uncharacterized protein METZ01_LOCUS159822, partial [marine metagenome]